MTGAANAADLRLLEASSLSDLCEALRRAGYLVVRPTVRDGAIVLADLGSAGQLPFGWGVTLGPGGYRLRQRTDQAAFIIAVNCTEPGETCFCTSMGTGPEAGPGYDLALTELVSAGQHRFLVEVGSAAGAQVLAGVPVQDADDATVASARTAVAGAAELMGRSMPAGILHELIAASHDAARWDDVAARCLSCGKLHDGLPDLSPRCGPKRGRNCGETGSRRAPWPATSSCAGWPTGTSRCSPGRPVWLPSSQVTGSSRRAARPAASG